MTFTFYSDPGHAWLEVPLETYNAVCKNTGWQASAYSYFRGRNVYLEEDVDAPAFLRHFGPCLLDEEVLDDYAPIRNYQRLPGGY